MTPEQEIERIKRDYKEHWPQLEKMPRIQEAIAENNPIKLGEAVSEIVHGNIWKPTKDELSDGTADYENHLAYLRREQLIAQKLSFSSYSYSYSFLCLPSSALFLCSHRHRSRWGLLETPEQQIILGR